MKLIALVMIVPLVFVLLLIVKRVKHSKLMAKGNLEPENYKTGIEHYNAGRMLEAEYAFRETIRISPGFADAHFKLGNLLTERSQFEEAKNAYLQALRLKPDYHQAYNNLGNLLRFNGQHQEANAAFRSAIDIKPDFPEALNNLGILLIESGDLEEAENVFRQSVRIGTGSFDVLYNLAMLLEDRGKLDEAETTYHQVLGINPDFSPAANALGLLLAINGRPQEAESYFRDVVRLNPDVPFAYKNLGLALKESGGLSEAEACYRQALAIQPKDSDTLNCLAELLTETNCLEEAESTYRLALKVMPDNIEALNNLGILLRKTKRMDEAESAHLQALAIKPDSAATLNDLGALYMSTARFQEAETAFRQALKLDPTQPEASDNFAVLNLLFGNFELGWEGKEYRWKTELKNKLRGFSQPRWDGKAFPGKTLLVHCEQGAGDSIQFFRYLPRLKDMGGSLVVECPPFLFRLFRENLATDVRLVRYQEALPDFDFHCPLMSLPLHFNTRLETIPADVPYMKPSAEAVANCPTLQTLPGAPFKVGVVWAGNPQHPNDNARSLDFSLLEPLFAIEGITWVILQMEQRPEGFECLVKQNGWLDPMDSVMDFADTAAVIVQLDRVIGVDTSVIHLAGALGKPVWLLLPFLSDWRWLLQREDSPWYPRMRLFRQTALDTWPEVIQRVATALSAERDVFLQNKSHI